MLAASCTAHRPPAGTREGRSLGDVYKSVTREGGEAAEESIRRDLQVQGTLGYVNPYVPVRTPPNVMPVWIPSFVSAEGDLVSGHWVYLVVNKEQWFVEEQATDVATPVALPKSKPDRPTRRAAARRPASSVVEQLSGAAPPPLEITP